MRRRGFAAAAMSGLVDEALEAGAEHIQLAVIEGNEPALNLYRKLGFYSFARLRTVLFTGPAGATQSAGVRGAAGAHGSRARRSR
jgi:ribosomal protein S18 acetylase RimI-like enzyme